MKLLEVLARYDPEGEAQDAHDMWPTWDEDGAEARAARQLLVAKLLLYLHARPCRTYSERSLSAKLGFVCSDALRQLAQLGLVVQSQQEPASFGYGVEDAEQLRAVDELSLRYHALAALTGFLASLSRHHGRAARARSRALRLRVTKPNQRARQEARHDVRNEPTRRGRRGPMRVSLGLALAARDQ
jgi:hypothetical protein